MTNSLLLTSLNVTYTYETCSNVYISPLFIYNTSIMTQLQYLGQTFCSGFESNFQGRELGKLPQSYSVCV